MHKGQPTRVYWSSALSFFSPVCCCIPLSVRVLASVLPSRPSHPSNKAFESTVGSASLRRAKVGGRHSNMYVLLKENTTDAAPVYICSCRSSLAPYTPTHAHQKCMSDETNARTGHGFASQVTYSSKAEAFLVTNLL